LGMARHKSQSANFLQSRARVRVYLREIGERAILVNDVVVLKENCSGPMMLASTLRPMDDSAKLSPAVTPWTNGADYLRECQG